MFCCNESIKLSVTGLNLTLLINNYSISVKCNPVTLNCMCVDKTRRKVNYNIFFVRGQNVIMTKNASSLRLTNNGKRSPHLVSIIVNPRFIL